MGIFDKVFGNENGEKLTLNEQDAFVAITISIIGADGFLEDVEINAVFTALERMKLFRGYDVNVTRVYKIIKRHGAGPIIEAAKEALSTDMRETAFAIAVDIALSDGHLDETEKDYLTQLYNGLELSEQLVTKIVEVIHIKNRG